MRQSARHSQFRQRGSAMVEFALVAPLFVLLLIAIMVLGIVINAKIVVTGAAREAGRTWAIVQDNGTARSKAEDAVRAGGLAFSSSAGTLFNPDQDVTFQRRGDYIYVTVFYRQPTFAPLISQILPNANQDGSITLRSEAVFRVER